MKQLVAMVGVTFIASHAWPEPMPDFLTADAGSMGEGWEGFNDFAFLLSALLKLALAAALGAAIAFHPRHAQTADTLEEIEAPTIYILYAVIGAIVGMMVVRYGVVVGFVLFGIGGLTRFRTVLRSARLTGLVIFVTLVGLSCGLDLPHVAVLAAAFGFALIYLLEARVTYRLDVRAVPSGHVSQSASAYRELLEQRGCRILSERKNPAKQKITFVFRTTKRATQDDLQDYLEKEMDPLLRGSVDWEID